MYYRFKKINKEGTLVLSSGMYKIGSLGYDEYIAGGWEIATSHTTSYEEL